jgi:hypothetical protein
MAHFLFPAGGDPDTVAWLRLSRRQRRAARASTREYLRWKWKQPSAKMTILGLSHWIAGGACPVKIGPSDLTKAQRRLATPWQPIVVPPGDAHFLSGRPNQDSARLILLGLNRRERRALKSPAGPKHQVRDYSTGHVTRSATRMTPLLSRLWIYSQAERRRQVIAASQSLASSPVMKVARGVATAAAVPIVAGKMALGAVKNLFRKFTQ